MSRNHDSGNPLAAIFESRVETPASTHGLTNSAAISSGHFHKRHIRGHDGPIGCAGCDTVQADHAPDGGVAQGIFHGILVRHDGRNQEEVEEGLEEEVEGQEEENTQTTTCTCMDGMR